MNDSKISVRYARALFVSALENKCLGAVKDDMELILELTVNNDFREMIKSPVISSRVKSKIISNILEKNVHDLTFKLVMLTIDNGRESYLDGIARCFIDEADRHNGITRAKLVTAAEIGDPVSNRVKEMLEKSTGSKVVMQQDTDDALTGGFILRVGDKFIDGSVRTQLRRIKKELTEE